MTKKIFAGLCAVFLGIFYALNALAAIEIKCAAPGNEQHPFTKAFKKMGEYVEKESNGKYKVSVYGDYKLGNTDTLGLGLQMGTIHFLLDSSGNLSTFTPELSVFDLPYVLPTQDAANHILHGKTGEEICKRLSTKNLTYLAMADSAYRNMTTSKPVNSLDDIRKQKIRVTLSPSHQKALNAMGIQATPMPASEVYTGIQQGVVDGVDIDYPWGVNLNYYEVTPYVFESGHIYSPQMLLTGTKWWNSLSPEDKKMFEQAIQVWLDEATSAHAALVEESKQKYLDKGAKIVVPDEQERARWIEAAKATRQNLTKPQQTMLEIIDTELKTAGLAK
ncbi:MAG: TRAP transporter substrate-binding protein [Desulfovibrio sp.]|nr:TRAP transporter substrate-binding protein [Desulfovibrio sp.]